MHPKASRGFTLVELLVVIGVISLLISILLPALERARAAAATLKCAANLRSIGQAMASYEAENQGLLPVSYNYRDGAVSFGATNTQTPSGPSYGYVHWSSYIYGLVPREALKCPAMSSGGLPFTDPQPGDFDSGQTMRPENIGTAGTPDPSGHVTAVAGVDGTGAARAYYPDLPGDEANRVAYTLNEALCGSNKYVLGLGTPPNTNKRTFKNVNVQIVKNPSGTILATEFLDSSWIVSGAASGDPSFVVNSHRPLSPFRAAGTSGGDSNNDPAFIAPATSAPFQTLRPTNATDFYRKADGSTSVDVITDYNAGTYTPGSRMTRLDLVGRNHGIGTVPADKTSNFLFLDGHVETKSVTDTVPADAPSLPTGLPDPTKPGENTPWEWGDLRSMYSLVPSN